MRFLFPIVLLLAACGEQVSDPFSSPDDFDGEPRCGAERFEHLQGKREAALKNVSLPSTARVLHPEDVIALDFSPDRLTIDVDTSGIISSVTCR